MTSILKQYTLPLIALLAMACAKDENQPLAETKEASVTLRTLAPANEGTDTNQLNTSETTVKSVRVYVFDGHKLDRMQYFDIPNSGMQLNMRAKVGSGKTFCAVVNELPAMKDELDHVGTPSALNAAMYSLADYIDLNRNLEPATSGNTSEEYFLPFYGEINNVTLTDEGASLSLRIKRAVARIDVCLRAEEKASFDCYATLATTLKVENSAVKGFFTSSLLNNVPGAARIFSPDRTVQLDKAVNNDKSSYKRVFSFYLPAQEFTQTAGPIKMTLADLTWGETTNWTYDPFLFGEHTPSFDNTIQPNMVYTLYCTLSQAAFPVNVSLSIEDWDVKVQHGGL